LSTGTYFFYKKSTAEIKQTEKSYSSNSWWSNETQTSWKILSVS